MRSVSRMMFCFLLLVAGSFPVRLLAQDTKLVTLQGTVVDAVTGQPIPGVAVSLDDLELRVVTDSAGAFIMTDVPLGPHQLAIRRDGYEERAGTLRVSQGGDMVLPMNPVGGPSASELSRVGGRIQDVDGGQPLAEVVVRFPQLGLARETDSDGRFLFQEVPPGVQTMTAERLGYSSREEEVAVEAGKILTLELTLAVEPIQLDPIEVTVESRNLDLEHSGFYERRKASSGTFITRERIEQRAPLFMTDLFQGLAGVKVVGGLGMGTQKAVVVSGSRALSFNSDPYSNPCYPAVWIDGQMVHEGSSGTMGSGPAFLDDFIQPDQVAGVEIYASAAQVPLQYNLFAACGVIVFWTRQGR